MDEGEVALIKRVKISQSDFAFEILTLFSFRVTYRDFNGRMSSLAKFNKSTLTAQKNNKKVPKYVECECFSAWMNLLLARLGSFVGLAAQGSIPRTSGGSIGFPKYRLKGGR